MSQVGQFLFCFGGALSLACVLSLLGTWLTIHFKYRLAAAPTICYGLRQGIFWSVLALCSLLGAAVLCSFVPAVNDFVETCQESFFDNSIGGWIFLWLFLGGWVGVVAGAVLACRVPYKTRALKASYFLLPIRALLLPVWEKKS